MGQFPPAHALAAARALRRGARPLLDAAVFPSLSARAW
jgi:hypothetical protein